MLKTKEDIKAQKAKDGGDQTNLVDTINEQKKRIKSQKFVSYSLLVTLVLSCLFWAFTAIKTSLKQGKNFSINFPKLNLPIINSSSSSKPTTSVEDIITENIDQNGIWAFYIVLLDQSSNQLFLYQKNSDELNLDPAQIMTNLQELGQSSTDFLSSSLPQGLNTLENFIQGPTSFQSELFINLPSLKQIYIFSKNSNPTDQSQSQNQLKSIIPQIYWYLVQLD